MRITILFILIIITGNSFAQKTNYCEWTGCTLPENDEAHFDPYYNGHLCENFNPKQIDFSQEYLKLQTDRISKIATNVNSKIKNYAFDLDSLFNTNQFQQNGVLGLQNKRIKIHISKTETNEDDNMSFTIYGKSNVNGNICDFKGNIKIIKVFEILENYDFNGQGEIFAEYQLFEDKTQNHVGFFKGVFECAVKIDHNNKTIKLDDSFAIADAYFNRSYVGTWTNYKSKIVKKCIWGDYRLPFTFDFDCGDGEMKICDKYVKNGWESFNSSNEYEMINNKFQLKNKWWKDRGK